MPANLTPEYKAAEAEFRKARDPHDRLEALRVMLRTVPKHKGTEHLRADIKTRIKELTDELAHPRRAGTRSGPATVYRPEGAAQVALLGPPNAGKSTLHDRLTGSHAVAGPYPFTTQYPQPGMMPYEDISIQLIDLPAISSTHPVPWIANALQPADGALLVIDLGIPGCVAQVVDLISFLEERSVILTGRWQPHLEPVDPLTKLLPTLLIANKSDTIRDVAGELAAFGELSGVDLPSLPLSAATGERLEDLSSWLFERLGVVRVYTKIPGKDPDMSRPYTLRSGQTIGDLAELVHRDLAHGLRYARVWGRQTFEGQQVGRDHAVVDGDIVELHG